MTVQYAMLVRRRTATFPSRVALYFDFTPWGGGYLRATNNGPGAIVLADGLCADTRTGRVYHDARFELASATVEVQS